MKLHLRPALFWDTQIEDIELEKHKAAIIERITKRGRLKEFRALLGFYGKETVKNVLLNTRYLDKVTLSFCSAFFQMPKSEFRCYKLAQSKPEHWSY